ncbi:anti-sigma factor antagonist [Patescibacteria group bacterium]|nr:anti-sigma factor antagonist [Patescibacteria group bacterium]
MTDVTITIEDAQSSSPDKKLKIVHISGQLDESNVDEKIQEIYKLLEETPSNLNLILDLENLEYMNSKSIGYMTDLYGKITEGGGNITIAKARANIIDILQVVGLTQLIQCFDSMEMAKAGLTDTAASTPSPQPAVAPATETPATPTPEAAAPPVPEQPAQPEPQVAPAPEQPAQPEQPVQPEPTVAPTPEQPAQPEPTVAPAPEQPIQPEPAVAPAPEQPVQPEPAATPVQAPTVPEQPANPEASAPSTSTQAGDEASYKFEQ